MIPLDGKARDLAQEISLGPERLEVLYCLLHQQGRLLPSAFDAEQRHEGFLAGRAVLANPFTRLVLFTFNVEEIVGNLECQPDVAGVTAKACAALRRYAGHDCCAFQAKADERSGLQLLQPSDGSDIEAHLLGGQIYHLPAGHTRRTGSSRESGDQLRPDERIFMSRVIGEHFEGERVQGVARKDGRAFVEGLMNRRLPAPQVVIVHTRKVVVDQ